MSPCFNCESRKVGCHSGCVDYGEYVLEVDRIRHEEQKHLDWSARAYDRFTSRQKSAKKLGKTKMWR